MPAPMWRRKINITSLPKRHLQAFLDRPRLDYRSWKTLSLDKLEARHARLPADIPSWDKLHQDQKVCALIGARQPRFAFFNDPGTGKTMLSLTLARYHRRIGNLQRVLVLVPNKSNCVEWGDEVAKHYPKTKFVSLTGSSRNKWMQLEANPKALITVTTYAGFTRMASDKKGKTLTPNLARVKKLAQTFQGLVLDESSEVKGHDSLIFRICRKLSKTSHMVLVLSGTPFGRDPTALWAQMNLVDGGETLGETLGLFRGIFFKTSVNYFGGFQHRFIQKKRSLIYDMLANRSIRYPAKEADLPKVVPIIKRVELSEEARDWYERATGELRAAAGDFTRVKNTFLRMRQLSSGFVGLPADEDGRKAKVEFAENPKLEQLLGIVQSIPLEYPAIMVHEFIYSGERICQQLEEQRIPFVYLRGGVKDEAASIRKFKTGRVTRLVINHKAGGFGLNLQNAAYMLFYESPVSSIIRKQVEARFIRRYSAWDRVFRYDLLAINTMDERIREFHTEGDDLFKAILEGRARI